MCTIELSGEKKADTSLSTLASCLIEQNGEKVEHKKTMNI
jgi:hypothetical protein